MQNGLFAYGIYPISKTVDQLYAKITIHLVTVPNLEATTRNLIHKFPKFQAPNLAVPSLKFATDPTHYPNMYTN